MAHNFSIRVYYEDTDAGGVVYYANYLKFAERARTEWLRQAGIDQSALDIFFVVRHAELDLMKPARLDDLLTVETEMAETGKASFTLRQRIKKLPVILNPKGMKDLTSQEILRVAQDDIATIVVKIACVSKDFRPTRIPEAIHRLMG